MSIGTDVLTFGLEDLRFRRELDELVRAGKSRVVLNLANVSELDTTGLGTLLFAVAKLRKAGGDLALVNVGPSHIKVLMEARLTSVLAVFKDDQDAINSFFPGREVQPYDILEFARSIEQVPEKS